ncbi:MAG: hypothetical protein WA175_00725 [Candidatus Acidiferrales bacterium]
MPFQLIDEDSYSSRRANHEAVDSVSSASSGWNGTNMLVRVVLDAWAVM